MLHFVFIETFFMILNTYGNVGNFKFEKLKPLEKRTKKMLVWLSIYENNFINLHQDYIKYVK